MPSTTCWQNRSHLKKVFSPDFGVDAAIQVLDIREYVCGLNLGLALISSENPNFEIASMHLKNVFSLDTGVEASSQVPATRELYPMGASLGRLRVAPTAEK